MKPSEVRDMETQALLDLVESKREELFKLRMNWVTNKLENPNQMRAVRKDIARALTILRERELAAELVEGESNG